MGNGSLNNLGAKTKGTQPAIPQAIRRFPTPKRLAYITLQQVTHDILTNVGLSEHSCGRAG